MVALSLVLNFTHIASYFFVTWSKVGLVFQKPLYTNIRGWSRSHFYLVVRWPIPSYRVKVDHGTFLCFSHVSLYSRRSTIDPTQQSLRLTRAKMPEVNKFRFISPGLSPETSHGSGGTKWGLWGILKTSLLCYSWRVNCNIQLQKRTCGLIILNICILFWIV